MGDVGYRGVSADQDGRFRNKEQALLKKLASDGLFAEQFSQKVNMSKVNVEVMKPWISDKVQELLGFEDDVVVEYIHGMLEDPDNQVPDPKKMQLSLTGFLEGQTAKFMADLWSLLLSAQKSLGGIPQEFVEKKKEEMRLAREKDQRAIHSSGAVGGPASIHDHRRAGPRGADAALNMSTGRGDIDEGGARRGGDSSAARGRPGGRGSGRFGREEGGGPSRRDFVDRSGNRTERVQDRGWGARAAAGGPGGRADRSPPYRSDPSSRQAYSRRAYEEDRQERRGSHHRDTNHALGRGRRAASKDRSLTPEMKDRRRSSPAPIVRGRDRSITPVLRADRRVRKDLRSVSRSLSRSYSPPRYRRRVSPGRSLSRSRSRSPPRRRRRRESSYIPPTDDAVRRKRRRSRSVTPPLPRRRLPRDSSVSRSPPSRASSRSRSRSPPPRRRKGASRSRSRTYSPRRPTR